MTPGSAKPIDQSISLTLHFRLPDFGLLPETNLTMSELLT